MPRALYISAFIPSERAPHAGGQAAFQNLARLEREGYEVTALICTTERVAKSAMPPQQVVFRQTFIRLLSAWALALLQGECFCIFAWPLINTRAHVAFERRLRQEIRSGNYELIYIDFTQAILPTWKILSSASPAHRPTVRACVHDLYIQKLLRSDSLIARIFLGPTAAAERQLLQWVDEPITLSKKDSDLTRLLYDCKYTHISEWIPPAWVGGVKRRASTIALHEILFFANFDRLENTEAICWFVQHALPKVAEHYRGIRLVLAGAGSDRVKVPVTNVPIERLGFVEDPGKAFERCHISIAPLAFGAGVKFKVLEALACKVPVLGTSIALEGIERSELTHEATRDGYADAMIKLLDINT